MYSKRRVSLLELEKRREVGFFGGKKINWLLKLGFGRRSSGMTRDM